MSGSLTVFCGGMYAEKSTALIREGKRHIIAGRNVVFLKPAIDNRYSEESVVTHDGIEHKAINVEFYTDTNFIGDFVNIQEVINSDVVCIDEVQFFPDRIAMFIDELIYQGKQVYVAGLDMDRFSQPFGVVPELMARAEQVKKFHAVCQFCGSDAWVTLGTEKLKNSNQVNVSNDYVPACRTCAEHVGGVK